MFHWLVKKTLCVCVCCFLFLPTLIWDQFWYNKNVRKHTIFIIYIIFSVGFEDLEYLDVFPYCLLELPIGGWIRRSGPVLIIGRPKLSFAPTLIFPEPKPPHLSWRTAKGGKEHKCSSLLIFLIQCIYFWVGDRSSWGKRKGGKEEENKTKKNCQFAD